MGIQSSINSGIGAIAGAGAIKKYIGGQKEIANNVKSIEKNKEIDEELKTLNETENVAKGELLDADAEINDTEVDAMKTIDEYYTAQESGKMTDKMAYDKALQSYRGKIESMRRQLQGSINWNNQIQKRKAELENRKNNDVGGKK